MADHGARVPRTMWNLVSSGEEAQDVFQETFLQHHLAMIRGRTIDNTAAWLQHDRAPCRVSASRRRKCGPGRRVPEELPADLPAPENDPHHRLVLERLRELAARLPERQAQVFAMRNFEQLSFAEIAAHLT
ncbi:MAG: sigma-70 family RNA polymerase sigma factor [bacterium]|nr:sigma-70 family RNA polymerase sigma factor [bacterium]